MLITNKRLDKALKLLFSSERKSSSLSLMLIALFEIALDFKSVFIRFE